MSLLKFNGHEAVGNFDRSIPDANAGSRERDRPVLGGNASSEVRMWIGGAYGRANKETGILEEAQLDNCHLNPAGNSSLWDALLSNKAVFQPNLTLLLNTSICNGDSEELPGEGSLRRLTRIRGRRFQIDVRQHGRWSTAFAGSNNRRLRYIPVKRTGDAVRIVVEETWGDVAPRIFGFEATADFPSHLPVERERIAWCDVVAEVEPDDLLPPSTIRSKKTRPSTRHVRSEPGRDARGSRGVPCAAADAND